MDPNAPKKPDERLIISRRKFLALGGGAAAGAVLWRLLGTRKKVKGVERKKGPQKYATGELEGHKFSSLFSDYTSIKGEVPEIAEIDFQKQLEDLWERKKHVSSDRSVVQTTGDQLVKEYDEELHGEVSLDEYQKSIDEIIDEDNRELDWNKIAEVKNMNSKERKLAEEVTKILDAKSIIAYSLTELMPSMNGELNKNVLAFLLQNAGTRYVNSIPAVYDPMTSFGPYQFTSYALYDANGERRGASIINKALPEKLQIPGSVAKLRGNDHHRAAHLFMINNICDLVKRSENTKGWKSLKKDKDRMKKEITLFCATAHHMPAVAIGRGATWLDEGAEGTYTDCLGAHLKMYSKKTKANLEALE